MNYKKSKYFTTSSKRRIKYFGVCKIPTSKKILNNKYNSISMIKSYNNHSVNSFAIKYTGSEQLAGYVLDERHSGGGGDSFELPVDLRLSVAVA